MKVTMTSIMSGKVNTLDLPITQDQIDMWDQGYLIQDAMPDLTPDEREFLMTGITPSEWAEVFTEENEEWDDIDQEVF